MLQKKQFTRADLGLLCLESGAADLEGGESAETALLLPGRPRTELDWSSLVQVKAAETPFPPTAPRSAVGEWTERRLAHSGAEEQQ